MRRITNLLLLATVFALPLGASLPTTGSGLLKLTASAPLPSGQIKVAVIADLTQVQATGCQAPVPVVLGGYDIPLQFSPTAVQFVSAASCSVGNVFPTAPVTTAAATANANGVVSVVGAQPSLSSPTGEICLAELTFQQVAPVPSTITVAQGFSLASSGQSCAGGGTVDPVQITATGGSAAIAATAVPVASEYALALLACFLGFAGYLLLRR